MVEALRDERDRVLFCVDGVHGLGIEDVTVDDPGCDFLIAGTRKWLFRPRGTGLIWGHAEAFQFHLDIGKARVQERIHTLNAQAKEARTAEAIAALG